MDAMKLIKNRRYFSTQAWRWMYFERTSINKLGTEIFHFKDVVGVPFQYTAKQVEDVIRTESPLNN